MWHVWAAIGWNFKSELVFYNIPTNQNGKMTGRVYIDSILEPMVKKWLDNGDDFILEEDDDSGHGHTNGRGKNPVWEWKEKNHLKRYKNCPQSPDFSIIENCWQPLKAKLDREPHWSESQTLQAIKDS